MEKILLIWISVSPKAFLITIQAAHEMSKLMDRVLQKSHRKRHVRQLRLYTFLRILKTEHSAANKRRAVDEALRVLRTIKHIRETRLNELFTPAEVSRSWEKANKIMIESYTEFNTSVAEEGDLSCHICMDKVGDFLLIHGDSAHGGVCGACALRILLDGHKCPFCVRSVRMMCARDSIRPVDSTKEGGLRIFDT